MSCFVMFLVIFCVCGCVFEAFASLNYAPGAFQNVPCASDFNSVVNTLFDVSLKSCKKACIGDINCGSVVYIRSFHACQMMKTGTEPTDKLVVNGQCAKYAVPRTIRRSCRSDRDCKELNSQCIFQRENLVDGRCVCDKFHRYDPERLDCIQDCSSMQDNFTVYENKKISYYNDLLSSVLKLDACLQACINEPACTSIDYVRRDEKCHRSTVSVGMILEAHPEAFAEDPGITFYSRMCI